MQSIWVTTCLMIALLGIAPAFAEEPQDEAGKAYREAYKLIIDEKWLDSIKSFQEMLKRFPNTDWSDDAQFWLCFATEKTETALDKAFECHFKFVQANPKSEWANDAKMNMVRLAQQLAKDGKPQYQERVRPFGNTSDNEIEVTVLMTLIETGDEGYLAKVVERLDRISNEEVRSRVVRMLGDHSKSPVVIRRLVEAARKDTSIRVRQSALRALAENKSSEALVVLKELALSDESVEIRKFALRRLGELQNPDKEILLLLKKAALTDPSDSLREAAVMGLAEIRDSAALAVLMEVYAESKSREVRRGVVRAASERRQDVSSVLSFLLRAASGDADMEVRQTAILAIGRLKTSEGLEKLKEIASSNMGVETREIAVRAMAENRSEGAMEALIALLKVEKDARMRRELAFALREFKKDSVVPILAGVARTDANTDVRKAAVRALGEINTPAAREALLKLLDPK